MERIEVVPHPAEDSKPKADIKDFCQLKEAEGARKSQETCGSIINENTITCDLMNKKKVNIN